MRGLIIRLLATLAALLVAACGLAQRGGRRGGGTHTPPPELSSDALYSNPAFSEGAFDPSSYKPEYIERKLSTNEQPPCFQWPMAPVASNTVSASRMSVPKKAQKEFVDACVAVRKKKLKEGQKHLNSAIASYREFADAWVLLGQIQEKEGDLQQAEQSCARARTADSSYLPGYLCLADVAARQNQWAAVAQLSDQVIGMHPVKAPGAFFFSFLGHFYLKEWDPAEKSALQALKQGSKEQDRQLHWTMAKMYELKGDRTAEAAQLREYLKLYPEDPRAPVARHVLRQIEAAGFHAKNTRSSSEQ